MKSYFFLLLHVFLAFCTGFQIGANYAREQQNKPIKMSWEAEMLSKGFGKYVLTKDSSGDDIIVFEWVK